MEILIFFRPLLGVNNFELSNCFGFGRVDAWSILRTLVDRFGSPLYCYLPTQASEAYRRVRIGLESWESPAKLAYSLKTNPFFGLLRDLRLWGSCVEVVSSWEYGHAINLGFHPQQMIFNGPLKSRSELHPLRAGWPSLLNIDSLGEIETIGGLLESCDTINVGVRLCPPFRIGGSRHSSKFGMGIHDGEAAEAIRRIQEAPGMQLGAIHFHLGAQVVQEDFIAMLLAVQDFWRRNNLPQDIILDIGGGFPYEHDRPLHLQRFDPVEFFTSLRRNWWLSFRPRLIVEPGRTIAAPALIIVSTVLASKSRPTEPSMVIVDSGNNHNTLIEYFPHLWLFERVSSPSRSFRVGGPLCAEDDVAQQVFFGGLPQPGSLAVTAGAGAYSFALSRTFIQPRPAIVSLDTDGTSRLLTPREAMDTVYGFSSDGRVQLRRGE